MPFDRGRPGCPYCSGRGIIRSGKVVQVCRCTRPDASTAALIRKASERPGRPFKLPGDAA